MSITLWWSHLPAQRLRALRKWLEAVCCWFPCRCHHAGAFRLCLAVVIELNFMRWRWNFDDLSFYILRPFQKNNVSVIYFSSAWKCFSICLVHLTVFSIHMISNICGRKPVRERGTHNHNHNHNHNLNLKNLAEREENSLKRGDRVSLEKPCMQECETKIGGLLMIGGRFLVQIQCLNICGIFLVTMKPAGESSANRRPSRINPTLGAFFLINTHNRHWGE